MANTPEMQSFYTPSTSSHISSHAPAAMDELISKYSSTMSTSTTTTTSTSHHRRNILLRMADRVRLEYYRYEVTFGLYVMTPLEKLAANTFVMVVMSLLCWALLLYFPSLLYQKLSRLVWLLTGQSGAEMGAVLGILHPQADSNTMSPAFSTQSPRSWKTGCGYWSILFFFFVWCLILEHEMWDQAWRWVMEYIYLLQHTKPDQDNKLITDSRLSISADFYSIISFISCRLFPIGVHTGVRIFSFLQGISSTYATRTRCRSTAIMNWTGNFDLNDFVASIIPYHSWIENQVVFWVQTADRPRHEVLYLMKHGYHVYHPHYSIYMYSISVAIPWTIIHRSNALHT